MIIGEKLCRICENRHYLAAVLLRADTIEPFPVYDLIRIISGLFRHTVPFGILLTGKLFFAFAFRVIRA